MKRIILVMLMMFGVNSQLIAGDVEDVAALFKIKSDKVVAVVKDKSVSADERNDKIIDLIDPMFDFKLMAQLALGKAEWRSLDDAKQDEFTKLYVERMKTSYSKKIDNYTDEKIIVKKQYKDRGRITIETDLVGSDEPLEVIYKYWHPKQPLKNKDAWLVYDVVIAGVSIIKTDRSQFAEVLRDSSIEQLMDKMRVAKK